MVTYLCEISKVSRSGYYNYFSEQSKLKRVINEVKDSIARSKIEQAYNYKNINKGARQIKMVLEKEFDIVYNLKKIRRVMKKYNIVCPIRKAKPYKQISKAIKENSVVKNILKRNFKQNIPGKVLLTDITFLNYGKTSKRAYLSTIKDGSTNEILAYDLSHSINLEIAINTVNKLVMNKDVKIQKDSLIHSDQGFHYTSNSFQKLIKFYGIKQSMSRRGNCWDNAPQESFFGHLKSEICIKECEGFEELGRKIDNYIAYYNNSRYQWNLKKMTPVQYRNHLLNTK